MSKKSTSLPSTPISHGQADALCSPRTPNPQPAITSVPSGFHESMYACFETYEEFLKDLEREIERLEQKLNACLPGPVIQVVEMAPIDNFQSPMHSRLLTLNKLLGQHIVNLINISNHL